jgi:tetratricopeptide (TPR) repeat protein
MMRAFFLPLLSVLSASTFQDSPIQVVMDPTHRADVVASQESDADALYLHSNIESLMDGEAGQLAEIEGLLREALALPSSVFRYDHLLRLAHILMQKGGSSPEAFANSEAAVAINETAVSRYFACWTGTESGAYAAAERNCRACLQIEPSFHRAHSPLATSLFQQGKKKEALPHYRAALMTPEGNTRINLNALGFCLRSLDRREEEFALYEKAVAEQLLPSVWQRPPRYTFGVPALPWYETSWFNWIPALEAALPVIRAEFHRMRAAAQPSDVGDVSSTYAVDRLLYATSPGLWSSIDLLDQGAHLPAAELFPETLAALGRSIPIALDYGRVLSHIIIAHILIIILTL